MEKSINVKKRYGYWSKNTNILITDKNANNTYNTRNSSKKCVDNFYNIKKLL